MLCTPTRPDQSLQVISLKAADEFCERQDGVDLVVDFELEFDAGAEDLAALRVKGEAVESGRRVCGNPSAPPLDDITVVVVMRRFDQGDEEFFHARILIQCRSNIKVPPNVASNSFRAREGEEFCDFVFEKRI